MSGLFHFQPPRRLSVIDPLATYCSRDSAAEESAYVNHRSRTRRARFRSKIATYCVDQLSPERDVTPQRSLSCKENPVQRVPALR